MIRLFILISATFLVFNAAAQLPENWTDDEGLEVFQESSVVFSGEYSAGIIINSNDQNLCDFINTAEIPVTPGNTFRISFYGFTSQNVRARAFFYWIGALRTNSTNYLGPNTGGWQQFEFEATVPDNATGLNLGIRFYTIPGFTPGEIQRLDEITFESPTGNLLTVANGDFETWTTILPEPDEYPTDFSATAAGFNAVITWTDPQEGQLPDNYLIKISTSDDIPFPEDGSYIPDDLNLSDGEGSVNVPFGQQKFTFTGLQSLTGYNFTIFPYTNTGTNIDYKTDGMPPKTEIQTTEITILETENFDTAWGNWNVINISGDETWSRNNNFGINNSPCARMTGVSSGNIFANEDWLISPTLNFSDSKHETLTFFSAVGFSAGERQLTLKISTDYDGQSNPNEANWTELDAEFPDNTINFEWTFSGVVDISAYVSDSVYIAFVYSCDNTEASTWQIDNIEITASPVKDEPSEYPTDFSVLGGPKIIFANWTDATGDVIPDGYLLLIGEQPEIELPLDSIPVEDDYDLSDGKGAVNLMPVKESHVFTQLKNNNDYYLSLFPYTNTGLLINYKTDGDPPLLMATTDVGLNEFLITTFDESWQGWEQYQIQGDNPWQRNNTLGLNNSACAAIANCTGYLEDSENWLISPPVNLENTISQTLDFFSAKSQNFGQLQILASDDYDGSENPTDFSWNNLSEFANLPGENQLNSWTWSELIDISEYENRTIYIAFKFSATADDSVRWSVDDIRISGQVTGIDEPDANQGISIFPNPGNGIFYLESKYQIRSLQVFDRAGQNVFEIDNQSPVEMIDLKFLPEGIYFLRILTSNPNSIVIKKFIIH
jgi:hypothetical protein